MRLGVGYATPAIRPSAPAVLKMPRTHLFVLSWCGSALVLTNLRTHHHRGATRSLSVCRHARVFARRSRVSTRKIITMISRRRALRSLGARACALLVLTGLVAMHSLRPHALKTQHERAMSRASIPAGASMANPGVQAHAANSACHQLSYGDSGGGHGDHVNATCSASGISGGPALPALVTVGSAAAGSLMPQAGHDATASATVRAPLSRPQLQLLHI